MSQLSIRILTCKVPLDGSTLGIADLLPSIDLRLQKLWAGDTPIQTLSTEDSNLDLSHIQPTCVLWGVVKLHTAQEFLGSAYSQYIVKTLSEVGVQVVQHQVNSTGLGVCASEQLCDERNKVDLSPALGDRDYSLATFGLDSHEKVGCSVAHVLVVLLGLGWRLSCAAARGCGRSIAGSSRQCK